MVIFDIFERCEQARVYSGTHKPILRCNIELNVKIPPPSWSLPSMSKIWTKECYDEFYIKRTIESGLMSNLTISKKPNTEIDDVVKRVEIYKFYKCEFHIVPKIKFLPYGIH